MAMTSSQAPSKMNIDDWSVREKLVLACCVVRSGDQNWASVSRTIKPICEAVESRPSEWFSQKNCANQYSSLLEGTSTKKRKRTSTDSGANETPMEQIIRKLSFERIDELKKAIQADRKKYKKLKSDIEKIRSGKVDDQLQKIWNELHRGSNIPIECVIHEEVPEFQLALASQFHGAQNVASNSGQAFHHQQQHSSVMYHRSKSQRQSKATKKYESWMTQLKQQQARHHQSHSGSAHSSPHGQPISSQTDTPTPTNAPVTSVARQQSFYQGQFPHQIPYSSQQSQQHQEQLQQEQHLLLQQHQQQQQHQQLQQHQLNQRQGYSQVPSRTQSSTDVTTPSQGSTNEPGSVLSSLLTAPAYEIKAVAALQKQKILEEQLAVKDSVSPENESTAAITSSNQYHSTATSSVLSSAPTLSKLLEPASKPTSPQHQVSILANEEQQDSESKQGQQKESPKEGEPLMQLQPIGVSVTRLSPTPQVKTAESSPGDTTSKKSTPESSRTTPVEPLRIKVEDEEYFPDNDGIATPDSSQPSPKSKSRRIKGKRGFKRKQPHHILLKSMELMQDSEDTCSVDELASERDETESEVASVSDAKDISDMEQDDGDEGGYQKMVEDTREHSAAMRRSRGRTSSNLSVGMVLSPNSPTLSVGSNEENSQVQKNWRKSIMLVWKSIASHKYANVFMHPVTDDEAPGYHSIIKRPMDLSTIKKNIENGGIRCTSEFHRDVMLMFQNALMYNREDHDVHRMADEMREEVMEQIQSFIATQLHLMVQSSDSMMLRGHRSDDEKELRRSKTHARASHKV